MASKGIKNFLVSFAKSCAVGAAAGYAVGYLGKTAMNEAEKAREIRRVQGPKTDEDLLREQLYAQGRNK